MSKKKGKEKKPTGIMATIGSYLGSLNNSKLFAGLIMIVLNIGSKYINIKLTKSQEKYLRNNVAKQLLIFAIAWMGTKDILISFGITAIFHILANHLLNEESSLCIIPHSMRQFMHLLDEDGDGELSEEEIKKAKEVLEKVKKRDIKREALRNMNNFKSGLL
tara:strand:+ start:1052 stop:1537 length:486 start_codon:yes stop_codon:yes gene_type:complete